MKNAPFTGQGPKRPRNGPRMPNGTVSKPTGAKGRERVGRIPAQAGGTLSPIRPQASKEDTYCPYGFFSKGSVECYSKDTMLKAVTACSRKQKAAYMSVITEALVLSAAQIEGGISNVQAAARRMGAAKSTDGSLCVRSEKCNFQQSLLGAHRPRDEKPAWQVAVLRRSGSSDGKRGLSQEEHKRARWQVLASQVVSRRLGLSGLSHEGRKSEENKRPAVQLQSE